MTNHFKILIDVMPSGSLQDINNSLRNTTWTYVQLLCYAVAGICGLVGGLRIYSLWNIHGRHHVHIDAQVVGWIGAAIFLLVGVAFVNMVF